MSIANSRDLDELCYPFIHETSWLCDYELLTDELCAQIGAVLSALPVTCEDIYTDLERLQPLIFHANGSIRGRMALTEQDLVWLKSRLHHYRQQLRVPPRGFVLPRGTAPVPQLHAARSNCKKAIRALVRVSEEGRAVPDILPRFLNLLCNVCFTLTLVINQREGVTEIEFVSSSYGRAGETG
jgi:ATP:cob(I)alamin adenosyltransferase